MRLDSAEKTNLPSPMELDTIVRVDGLIDLSQPTPGDDVIHDFRDCFKLLLNGRDVYTHDPVGRTLASYRKEAVSLPDDASDARDSITSDCEACRLAAEEKVSRCWGTQRRRDRTCQTQGTTCTAVPNSNENEGNMWISLNC